MRLEDYQPDWNKKPGQDNFNPKTFKPDWSKKAPIVRGKSIRRRKSK